MATYQFKVSIEETDPLVWRRIVVPDTVTFHQLHLVLQKCFQWKGYHLYLFETNEGILFERGGSESDSPWVRDTEDSLENLIDPFIKVGNRLIYTYDFGDDWVHVIDVESIDYADNSRNPLVVAYQGESMIEDCGGVDGYYETMRIIKDRKDPEYRQTREWVRSFAPEPFDLHDVNALLFEHLYFPKAAYIETVRADIASDSEIISKLPKVTVSLADVVDALSWQSDDKIPYIDLGTGRVDKLIIDDSIAGDLADESQVRYDACAKVLALPLPGEFDDYKVMCHFAESQEGAARDLLVKALNGRGAFRRFKNEVRELGIDKDWYSYRDEALADFARDFLEAYGVSWK